MISILVKVIKLVIRKIIRPSKKFLKIIKYGPYSRKFGFERGTPIDRKWMENFLSENSELIRGSVLEVTDNKYTKRFGKKNVSRSDVLDINRSNKCANIYADLRNPENVQDSTYDCIILTHVLGLIDDIDSVVANLHRVLKPGGSVLFSGSCLGPVQGNEKVFWRFNSNTVNYIFSKKFHPELIHAKDLGNAYLGCCMWMGLSQEEVNLDAYEYNDNQFPCNVVAVITKEK